MMETKQVIVIRKDLSMRKGKMIAQGAHASMAVLLKHKWRWFLLPFFPGTPLYKWVKGRFVKIVVSVDSEDELLEIGKNVVKRNNGRSDKMPYALIKDAGITEFHGKETYTALAIGPWWSKDIDKITGHLKLL